MANLRPERTGLPFVVFISQKGGARHDVRVKVAPGAKARPSEMVTVEVRPSVRVLRGALDPSGSGSVNAMDRPQPGYPDQTLGWRYRVYRGCGRCGRSDPCAARLGSKT